MISRISLLLLLLIVVPDVYIDRRFLRTHAHVVWWHRLLWWLPALMMIVYTLSFLLIDGFAPTDVTVLNLYLFLTGMVVVPKFLFMLCSLAGGMMRLWCHSRINYGNIFGALLVIWVWCVMIYGCSLGFSRVVVRQMTYTSPDLPAAFDGYRIVQFSDAHVGTYGKSRQSILRSVVDTIQSLHPDMIVFTGDLQNRVPQEIIPHREILRRLSAPDGIYSVMGNHDYAQYSDAVSEQAKRTNILATERMEREMGWDLLLNENRVIHRGNDSIFIAGMENDGDGQRFPQYGNVKAALKGVHKSNFVVMLQHDPTCWRRKILPHSHAQLTLSGHTHAMQFELFGWSPASLVYREWGGVFYEGKRAINVSTGVGGFLPFRFGVPGEVVVITLKKE